MATRALSYLERDEIKRLRSDTGVKSKKAQAAEVLMIDVALPPAGCGGRPSACLPTETLRGRVERGTRIEFEQAPVENGVWMPKHLNVKVGAKVLLIQGQNYGEDYTY